MKKHTRSKSRRGEKGERGKSGGTLPSTEQRAQRRPPVADRKCERCMQFKRTAKHPTGLGHCKHHGRDVFGCGMCEHFLLNPTAQGKHRKMKGSE